MAVKVLLDTDIGSDINDAICLAYLLAQPACELLGITTVTGEAVQRAMLASVLCKAAGKAVPIFPGQQEPLLVRPRQTTVPQARVLPHWAHDTVFPEKQAVRFLRQTIHDNPGEITLLTTGPLTNVALLFAVEPEIPALLRRVVMMAGRYTADLPEPASLEWNVLCDPYAFAKVLTSAAPLRAVGIGITSRVQLDTAVVLDRFWAPPLRPVLDFGEGWFQERDHLTFHDAVAAATIFDDQLCVFQRGTITVELDSEPLRGLTRWQADDSGPHEIAVAVDVDRFFAHFFAVLGG